MVDDNFLIDDEVEALCALYEGGIERIKCENGKDTISILLKPRTMEDGTIQVMEYSFYRFVSVSNNGN